VGVVGSSWASDGVGLSLRSLVDESNDEPRGRCCGAAGLSCVVVAGDVGGEDDEPERHGACWLESLKTWTVSVADETASREDVALKDMQ
jgi:hypothetical protein